MPTTPSSSEKYALLKKAGQNHLLNFCQLSKPGYEAIWFHELIGEKLEQALEDTVAKKKVRIILTIPPRHGKSELASVLFPAWALGKYPALQIILSTYGAELSEKMGLKTRDVMNANAYQAIFPEIKLRQDVKAKAKWMTNKGGSYTAVGIGGAVTGIGGDIIIVDDPHKSREEAESENVRETVWEYYRDTLYSRLEGFGCVIIIMQRWHTDDLVGRVLEDAQRLKEAGQPYDEWDVINFPAVAEEDEYFHEKCVRRAGEALWPSKFPLEVLDNIRGQSVYKWSSQYQQDPILAENQEFKQHHFKYYEPEDLLGKYLRYSTLVDPAISQRKSADNTVVLTIAKEVSGPNWYRIRENAGHFTPSQTIELIFAHQAAYGSEVYIETVAYQMALKYSLIEEQRKRERYFTIHEVKTQTNKETKIRGLLPLYEAGVIYHLRSDTELERELLSFPRGRHDDRIDAQAMGLEAVGNTRGRAAKQFKKKMTGYFRPQ